MKKVIHTSIFFLTLLFLAGSVSASGKKEEKLEKAYPFPRKAVWLNARPLNKKIFRQKVTLVYFWDYTSVNSLRELSILKRWYNRYQPYGFQMVFVHSPEFDFAKNKENAEKAVRRLQIPFPVILDNDSDLWESYNVRSWPTKFLVNGEGVIIHSQVGEGRDLEMEGKIREALRGLDSNAVLPMQVIEEDKDKFDIPQCGEMSAETYTGHKRASWWGGEIANTKGALPDQTILYRDRGKRVERGFFVEGLWTNNEDFFEHARDTKKVTDYIGLLYLAHEVYAVLGRVKSGNAVSRIYVTRDEGPVPPEYRGLDVKEDALGATYLLLQEPRLYYLIANEEATPHELKLWTQQAGTAVYSFSFSNHCLSDFDHL